MTLKRVALTVILVLVVGFVGFLAIAWRSEIAPIDPPQASSFDPALVRRGAQLAAIGNCNDCHTAPGGESFAGGLAIPTPFGTIYSTNITPDPETGIGRWSEAAFQRSMREGVDREGHHLYPAFPYDHFTLVTDDDNRALYAYLMTRNPVFAQAPENELPFPLNIRLILAGWKLLFFREGPYVPDSAKDEAWNRGAYLAEGLGHCGACHTPRNAFGAERKDNHFGGSEVEGWHAPALNAASPAPVPWDLGSLRAYLRRGWHEAHGVALGPMAPVVDNLASASDKDVHGIATYTLSIIGEPTPERRKRGEELLASIRPHGPGAVPAAADSQAITPLDTNEANKLGAAIYAGACAICHESGRPPPYGGLHLAFSTALNAPNAHNLLNVLLDGIPPAEGEQSPIMPAFAGALTDEQVVALAAYLRSRFSDKPQWSEIEQNLRNVRQGDRNISARSSGGAQAAPAEASLRETRQ